jgi:hypothetical protein
VLGVRAGHLSHCLYVLAVRSELGPSARQAIPTLARAEHTSELARDCGLNRRRRSAEAASRPEVAPTKALPDFGRSRGLVGASLLAIVTSIEAGGLLKPHRDQRSLPRKHSLTSAGAGVLWERACSRLWPQSKPAACRSRIATVGRHKGGATAPGRRRPVRARRCRCGLRVGGSGPCRPSWRCRVSSSPGRRMAGRAGAPG